MGWLDAIGLGADEGRRVMPLSPEERAQRAAAEAKVRRGLKASAAVRDAGKALHELKTRDLFRDTHESWSSYVHDVFKISTRRADQLVEYASNCALYERAAAEAGTDCSSPPSEYALRELSGLTADDAAEALTEAFAESPEPTAKTIRKAAAKRRKPKAKKARPAKAKTFRVGGAKVVVQPTHAAPAFRGWVETLKAALAKAEAAELEQTVLVEPEREAA